MNTEIITELDKILPVVVRVHGENHPELARVGELYEQLKAEPDAQTVEELRQLTGNFAVPADACPTYEKTYRDLETLVQELA